jgi:hypothetical protein
MNRGGFGWDLSWKQFGVVYNMIYRTVLIFDVPIYLFSIKICISEKGCKINDIV